MSSQAELTAGSGSASVCVDHSERGLWKVVAPGRAGSITCETLQDAEQEAYLSVARTHACELIVRDAYHRVLRHELIEGDRAAAPLVSSSPAPTSKHNTRPGGR